MPWARWLLLGCVGCCWGALAALSHSLSLVSLAAGQAAPRRRRRHDHRFPWRGGGRPYEAAEDRSRRGQVRRHQAVHGRRLQRAARAVSERGRGVEPPPAPRSRPTRPSAARATATATPLGSLCAPTYSSVVPAAHLDATRRRGRMLTSLSPRSRHCGAGSVRWTPSP